MRRVFEERFGCGLVSHSTKHGWAWSIPPSLLCLMPVNIIVWPSVAEEQRRALRGSKLLSVQGTWQSEKGVHSLVAMKLRDHSELLQGLRVASRDFR